MSQAPSNLNQLHRRTDVGDAVAPDGSIYVFDRNLSALRKYTPDGTYLTSFRRRGEGPGEFGNADGLAVLVWAVARDEYDVPSVVRYRLDAGETPGS